MKKRLLAVLAAFSLAAVMGGCSGGGTEKTQADTAEVTEADAKTGAQTEQAQSGAEEEKKLVKIGWSSDILSSNFTSGLAAKFQESCDALGIEIEMQDANRDMNLQINQVENMISNGCQVIILKPYDMSACEPISTACREAGVPLVVICSDISSDYDCAVLVDNATLGEIKGRAIAEALDGKGRVAFIHGTLSQAGWVMQADAAKAELAKYPEIEIVDEQVAENNAQDLAITVTENWITAGLDFDAIWCCQDTVAIGAGTACKEAGLENVYIVGQGGMEDAQIAIRDGVISSTVYLPSSVYVDGAMQAAQALFYGQPIDKDLYMETPLLTGDNIEGFQF